MDPSPFADSAIDLSPADVARRLAAGGIQLVDVREQHERDVSCIAGSHHREIDRIAWNYRELDRDRPVVFYCRLGWRAGMVATAFRAIGYDAYNLDGGMTGWVAAGLPIEPAGAEVSPH